MQCDDLILSKVTFKKRMEENLRSNKLEVMEDGR